MLKKRVIFFILTIVLIMSLIGCSNTGDLSEKNTADNKAYDSSAFPMTIADSYLRQEIQKIGNLFDRATERNG